MQPTAPQRLAALTVIHSLMPKGVEHAVAVVGAVAVAVVIHSLMPKGVEHQTGLDLVRVGEVWFIRCCRSALGTTGRQ
ncbi:MAG: hypothetical protein WCO86_07340 [Planctomycetota bacterium]